MTRVCQSSAALGATQCGLLAEHGNVLSGQKDSLCRCRDDK